MNDVLLTPIRLNELEALIQNSVEKALRAIPLQHSSDADEIFDVDAASDFLGLSKSTIYTKNSKGELPVMNMGGGRKLYFSRKELVEYLRAGRKMTNKEIQEAPEQFLKPRKTKGGHHA